ncbi:MAG TPA: AAA family ATPase [Vicinamibacterales bacterium]|nr:AAA family ATPase [Vicinamibacterales bacterium]
MYEEYYGFTEKPFSLTPDPKYLFKSESHANALELLQYANRRREGFVVVTGDIGTGKTTLCRALLEEIDRNTFTALVLNPFLSEEDLLKLILQDFGVVSREDVKRGRLAGVSKQELIETIYDFLLGLLPLHASAVLIIDEAQNLPMPVLEQIRILSNLETDKEKLLQIVLVGQLNLNTLLKAPQMRQLDQRVSIRYQLKPLTRNEVAAYVSHRVTIAGGATVVSFQPKALDLVHRLSEGIPRLINLLCDRALLACYSARANKVSVEMIKKAAESLEIATPKSTLAGWFRRHASVVVTAAGAAVSLAMAGGMVAPVLRAAPPVAATPVRSRALETALIHSVPSSVGVPEAAAAMSAGVETPADAASGESHYSVLAASFPVKDVTRDASAAAMRLDAVTARLQALGYTPRLADVDLKSRGEWRRVLVGEFGTLDEAMRQARQLHQSSDFADAQPIRY